MYRVWLAADAGVLEPPHLTKENLMKHIVISVLFLMGCSIATSVAQGQAGKEGLPPPSLDAVLRVKVDKLEISCQFDLPGKVDQSFQNTEYRYAVLDKKGVQVNGALIWKLPIRTISLPKDRRSVIDATDAAIVKDKLMAGEQYYLVVSVRNLTGMAKFKVP